MGLIGTGRLTCMSSTSFQESAASASGLSEPECKPLGSARSTLSVERSWPEDFQGDLFGETCEDSRPQALLPTPTAGDSRNSRNATANRTTTGHHAGTTLSDWILMSSAGASPASPSVL